MGNDIQRISFKINLNLLGAGSSGYAGEDHCVKWRDLQCMIGGECCMQHNPIFLQYRKLSEKMSVILTRFFREIEKKIQRFFPPFHFGLQCVFERLSKASCLRFRPLFCVYVYIPRVKARDACVRACVACARMCARTRSFSLTSPLMALCLSLYPLQE